RSSKLCSEYLKTNRHELRRAICQLDREERIDTAIGGLAETQTKLYVGCLTGSDSVSSRNGPLWSAAIARSVVIAALERVADSSSVLSPKIVQLRDVELCALGLTDSRLNKSKADGDEISTTGKLSCRRFNKELIGATPVGYLVDIVEACLTETRSAQAQRSIKDQCRRQVAVVSQ